MIKTNLPLFHKNMLVTISNSNVSYQVVQENCITLRAKRKKTYLFLRLLCQSTVMKKKVNYKKEDVDYTSHLPYTLIRSLIKERSLFFSPYIPSYCLVLTVTSEVSCLTKRQSLRQRYHKEIWGKGDKIHFSHLNCNHLSQHTGFCDAWMIWRGQRAVTIVLLCLPFLKENTEYSSSQIINIYNDNSVLNALENKKHAGPSQLCTQGTGTGGDSRLPKNGVPAI